MAANPPANLPERVRGMITSAAVGDALGWPQETRSNIVGGQQARGVPPQARFRSWGRYSGTQYARYQETVGAGEYSDDTQLLLAVARSCLLGERWPSLLSRVELPTWTLYPRGAGRAVMAAARSWAEGAPPWRHTHSRSRRGTDPIGAYFNAGANGVAMRIAPHVIASICDDNTALLSRVVTDGITTHGHPRALVGACIHAIALRFALSRHGVLEYGDLIGVLLDDKSWQESERVYAALPKAWVEAFEARAGLPFATSWEQAVLESKELLVIAQKSLARAALANDEQTLEALGCFDKSRNGSGTITAVAAAYVATRSAARPQTGLLRAAFLPNADTDTLASMAASLLGAIHGTEWLGPLAEAVQDAEYLKSIGTQLARAGSAFKPGQEEMDFDQVIPRPQTRVGVKDLIDFRSAAFLGYQKPGKFLDGRAIRDYEHSEIPTTGKARVKRLRLYLADGQSLVIDKVERPAVGNRPADTYSRDRLGNKRQQDGDLSGNSSEAHWSGANVVQVTLHVRNLYHSLRFYRDILGLRVENLTEGTASFANGLELTDQSPQLPGSVSEEKFGDVLITFRINNLSDVVRRINSTSLGHIVDESARAGESQLLVRDPDGHDLRLVVG